MPLPRASHASPAAAVHGYLDGVSAHSAARMRRYLAPSARPQLAASARAIDRARLQLVSIIVTGIDRGRGRAAVQLVATVCYGPRGRSLECRLLSRHPLGLTSSLSTVSVGGRWYVAEAIMPTA